MNVDRTELLNRKIETLDAAKQWIVELAALDLMFHFEDDPATIGNGADVFKLTFAKAEVPALRQRIEELYSFSFEGFGGCPIGWALAVMTAPKARVEFPDYDIASLPFGPGNFEDCSWHNDACPSFIDEKRRLMLFADYPKPEDREHPDTTRFSLHRIDAEGCLLPEDSLILATNDYEEVEQFVAGAKVPV